MTTSEVRLAVLVSVPVQVHWHRPSAPGHRLAFGPRCWLLDLWLSLPATSKRWWGGREGAVVGEGGVVWGGGGGFGDGRGLHLPSSQPLGVDVGPQGTTVKKHCGLMCNKSAFAYKAQHHIYLSIYIYIYI